MYFIPCGGCDSVYIGETDDFSRRLNQHRYSLRIADESSSLHAHRSNLDHNIELGGAKVVYKTSNIRKRKFIESFFINTVNSFNLKNPDYSKDIFIDDIIRKFSLLDNLFKIKPPP